MKHTTVNVQGQVLGRVDSRPGTWPYACANTLDINVRHIRARRHVKHRVLICKQTLQTATHVRWTCQEVEVWETSCTPRVAQSALIKTLALARTFFIATSRFNLVGHQLVRRYLLTLTSLQQCNSQCERLACIAVALHPYDSLPFRGARTNIEWRILNSLKRPR